MQIVDARLRGRSGLWDITIEGGTFARIQQAASAAQPTGNSSGTDPHGYRPAPEGDADPAPLGTDTDVIRAGGRLVVPPFAENHIHLDYVDTAGQPRQNASGTLFEGIELWAERKRLGLNDLDGMTQRALAAVRRAVLHGVGAIRTHVDVTDPELTGLHALLHVKEQVADWVDLQLIAFPQNTVHGYPDGLQLVERALAEGADVVGGIPHMEPTHEAGVASVTALFDLAEKYDVPVDMHCDEIDDPASRFVQQMAAETISRGLQGRVTVAHAVAMA